MSKRYCFIALLFCGCLFAAEDFDLLLKEGETAKLENPARLNEILTSLQNSEQKLSNEQRSYYYYLKGYHSAYSGDLDNGLSYMKRSLEKTQDKLLKIKASASLANLYAVTQNFAQGFEYLEYALSELPNINDSETQSKTLHVASIFYNQVGEYDLGLKFTSRLMESTSDPKYLCHGAMTQLESKVNIDIEQIEAQFIEDALATCNSAKEFLAQSFIIYYQGKTLFNRNQTNETLVLLKNNLAKAEATKYIPHVLEYYALLSEAFYEIGDFGSARSFAEKVIDLHKQHNLTKSLAHAYKTLYLIANRNQSYKDALYYHQKYKEADSAYIDEITARNLSYQLAKHNLSEKNSRIELLNKQNEVLRLEQNLSKEDAENKRLMIFILIMIITFITLWAYRTKKTHIKLRQLAEFDSLTGIANRRHFAKQAESSLKYNKASSQAVSFILFDLDKFKSINDTYGHPIGDWVLTHTPKPVQDIIRKVDVFGRIGGEEFAILLPGCELDKAREIAEEIRKALLKINTSETGHNFRISASFGITISRVSGYELENLMKHSDDAMYQAKRDGRNQVCIYSMPPTEYSHIVDEEQETKD